MQKSRLNGTPEEVYLQIICGISNKKT